MPVAGSEVDFRFDGHAASGSRPLLDQSAQARALTPFADKYRFERLRQQIGQLGDVRRGPPCPRPRDGRPPIMPAGATARSRRAKTAHRS
jgi:hypothetical protein